MVATRPRVCLRCLGAGRVASGDGGALTQRRDRPAAPSLCPECKGSGVMEVLAR